MNLDTLENMESWEWPENAGEPIIKALKDKSLPESERIRAASLGSDIVVMNDDMALLLLEILGDDKQPDELRAQTAVSLGPTLEYCDTMEFDDDDEEDSPVTEPVYEKIREALQKIYNTDGLPKMVRRRIMEGSVRAPMEWHEKAIREVYALDDTEWKITALFAMGYLQGFDKEILAALESDNEDIYYEALTSAGRIEIKGAWPYVEKVLSNPDSEKWLLISAIEASHINPEAATNHLTRLALSEDEDIAEAVEEAKMFLTIIDGEDDLD
ncbi:MAG: hypothetical protein GY765_17535 [bacterium]|nr:hypothetical protein [bacterium]